MSTSLLQMIRHLWESTVSFQVLVIFILEEIPSLTERALLIEMNISMLKNKKKDASEMILKIGPEWEAMFSLAD